MLRSPLTLLAAATLAFHGCGQLTDDSHQDPVVTIVGPSADSTYVIGDAITFRAVVEDDAPDPGSIEVVWTSDRDDEIFRGFLSQGESEFTITTLSAGTHTVIATATDPDGDRGQAAVTVQVDANGAPAISLVTPEDGSTWPAGQVISVVGTVSDGQDAATDLVVSLSADDLALVDGVVPAPDGGFEVSIFLETGERTLTATVTDPGGLSASAQVTLTISGANTPPSCGIESPASGEIVDVLTTLVATATDAEDAAPDLSVTFSSSVDGPLGQATPGDDGSVELEVSLSSAAHSITMTVTDSAGGTCEDQVAVTVSGVPVVEIAAPADGAVYAQHFEITLRGEVHDPEDAAPTLAVQWSSSIDGPLPTTPAGVSGTVVTVMEGGSLSIGEHEITLTATDPGGLSGSASITLIIEP
ncbi:hypothetical protein L6R50_25135 [Myxococcota bacterium]|nr:hypothetical protein [Myxococcota bacterium]